MARKKLHLYLVQKRGERQRPPQLVAAEDAHSACRELGLKPANAIYKDVTRRTLQPHHFSQEG